MSYGKVLLIALLMISYESFAGSLSTLVGGGSSGGSGKTLKKQIFTSSGTWVRPPGVEVVSMVECMGGGQAGENGVGIDEDPASCSSGAPGGHGGASGQFVRIDNISVTSDVVVTIGLGGASNGAVGGNSSFGSSLIAQGGKSFSNGGADGFRVKSASGGYPGTYLDYCSGSTIKLPSTIGLGLGERAGTAGSNATCGSSRCIRGGAGGAAGFGNGGNGGNMTVSNFGGSGTAGGIGAGGGGGGGCVKLGGCVGGSGGAGGNGYCAVYWWE